MIDKILKKLQSLDHKNKTIALIVLSGFAMFFVLYIWGAYFNFIIAQYEEPRIVSETTNDVGFFDKINNSLAFVYQSLISLIKYLVNFINGPKEYNINP